MIKYPHKKPKTLRDYLSSKDDAKYGRGRICPVCGKEAMTVFYDEFKQKWTFKHRHRYQATVYHYAD